jgi:hypothetical protein
MPALCPTTTLKILTTTSCPSCLNPLLPTSLEAKLRLPSEDYMNRYESSLSKKYEIKMQELRHERKSEGWRLDDLRKVLQTGIQGDPKESKAVDVA